MPRYNELFDKKSFVEAFTYFNATDQFLLTSCFARLLVKSVISRVHSTAQIMHESKACTGIMTVRKT